MMESPWISAPHDRPRCRATEAHGQRCREPVVWDDAANRPVSTRCRVHGGLNDAALIGGHSPYVNQDTGIIRPSAGAIDTASTSMKKISSNDPRRPLAGLLSLALAGVLCLSLTGPAYADYDSAVRGFERGAYWEAQKEFQALAEAGDTRAQPYLKKIQHQLDAQEKTETSETGEMDEIVPLNVRNAINSFVVPDDGPTSKPSEPSAATASSATADVTPSGSAPRPEGTWGEKPAGWKPWSPFNKGTAPAPHVAPQERDVIVPEHDSFWSSLFHLPADATVVGLQHAAVLFEADNLRRELQAISRHKDEISLSILAGFWWLVLVRGLVGIGLGISRMMKAATTMRTGKRYG
jgi:hypothetical protein